MLSPCGRDLPPDRQHDTVESSVCSYSNDTGAEYTAAPYDTSLRPSAYAHGTSRFDTSSNANPRPADQAASSGRFVGQAATSQSRTGFATASEGAASQYPGARGQQYQTPDGRQRVSYARSEGEEAGLSRNDERSYHFNGHSWSMGHRGEPQPSAASTSGARDRQAFRQRSKFATEPRVDATQQFLHAHALPEREVV